MLNRFKLSETKTKSVSFWTIASLLPLLAAGPIVAGPIVATDTALDPASLLRPENLAPYTSRPITQDVIYFVLPDRFQNGDTSNDRGQIEGGVLDHGFDPTQKGFFHGGDLKGLTDKLDYMADMGISAVWLTPIFKNKAVQGKGDDISAGYHGYWVTDFTQIDPHLGTNEDLKRLITEAHKRNMKVFFDIITNHTADVIQYEECNPSTKSTPPAVADCSYRDSKDYPFTTIGGPEGIAVNHGFKFPTPEHQTVANFSKLTNLNFAYTPYIPRGQENLKVPGWLNKIDYYHLRGDSHWTGESKTYGDFIGLDDVNTEHPDVMKGFTDIYKHWISEFKIDGFRIDTAKHVNTSFWQYFAPKIMAHAKSEGIPKFYMFGEVYDANTKVLSHYTNDAKMPYVLDFAFQSTATKLLTEQKGAKVFEAFTASDADYQIGYGGNTTEMPLFLGNHDMGRIGRYITQGRPDLDADDHLALNKLAHTLMYFTRGVPVIYYGDEQGFIGDGNDQDARENMFPSQVASYNDNLALGSDVTPAADNFDTNHVLYAHLQSLAVIKRLYPALQTGVQSVVYAGEGAQLVFRRTLKGGQDIAVLINGEKTPFQYDMSTATQANSCLLEGDTAKQNENIYELGAFGWAIVALNCK